MRRSLLLSGLLFSVLSLAQAGCALETPGSELPPTGSVELRAIDVAVSEQAVCVVTHDHALFCWGRGELGALGTGDLRSSEAPARVPVEPVVDVELGPHRGCAITVDRHVVCWGMNSNGQSRPSLERDPLPERPAMAWCTTGEDPDMQPDNIVLRPTRIAGIDDVRSLSLTFHRTCASTGSGRVACWGENRDGVFGVPTEQRSFVRHEIERPGAVAVVATPRATVIRDARGHLQLVAASAEPELPGASFEDVELGYDGGCGRLTDGRVTCWGPSGPCMMGDARGEWTIDARATDVALGSGSCTRCYLDDEGVARCWPLNDGERIDSSAVVPFDRTWVLDAPPLRRIELGAHRGCGIAVDGRVLCFPLDATGTDPIGRVTPVVLSIGR